MGLPKYLNLPPTTSYTNPPENQIRPFNLTTPDGETLYAWHVLPIGAYHKHTTELLLGDTFDSSVTASTAFKILTSDAEARLVISFHGNAGHVGQGWRTDAYRALSAGASDKIHVLAFDYRGFGRSTGSPSEQGLIVDGVAAVDWALNVARLPSERIALVGQSLGTAVASAVAEYFAVERGVDLGGLGLIAPFSGLVKLLGTYSIGGFVPVLKPLKRYPRLQKIFEGAVVDTWHTQERIGRFVRESRGVNLVLVHAYDDFDIHWSHSDALFYAAANATSNEGLSEVQIDAVKEKVEIEGQGSVSEWKAGVDGGLKRVRHVFLRHGGEYYLWRFWNMEMLTIEGHNRITTYPVVSKMVLDLFGI